MKTITLLILLSIATLISCGDSVEENQDFVPPTTEIRETYKLKEYYEKPVVINSLTTDDDVYGYRYDWYSSSIKVGMVIFQGRYINNEILDTLTINLNSYNSEIKVLHLSHSYSAPNQIEHKYATINYLNIIGLEQHPDLKIVGDGVYDKVQINNSNISVEKLNSISVRNNNIPYDIFEKVELRRKEVSFTFREHSTPQYPSIYHNFVNQEKGFIGYGYGKNEGTKYQIISKDK